MSYNRILTAQTEQLFQASDAGDAAAVSALLLDPETDRDWHCPQAYGATPLLAAIMNGHAQVVQLLLDAGAELGELKTPDRNSPLHEAAFRGQPGILRAVLSKIQENPEQVATLVNAQNQFGNAPLHNAARSASPECVELLLAAGAAVNLTNVNGSTALHHACYSDTPNLRVVELLVAAGAEVDARDEQGGTALMAAAKKNQADVISFLRSKGADASVQNVFGEDAAHFAQLRDHAQSVQSLAA